MTQEERQQKWNDLLEKHSYEWESLKTKGVFNNPKKFNRPYTPKLPYVKTDNELLANMDPIQYLPEVKSEGFKRLKFEAVLDSYPTDCVKVSKDYYDAKLPFISPGVHDRMHRGAGEVIMPLFINNLCCLNDEELKSSIKVVVKSMNLKCMHFPLTEKKIDQLIQVSFFLKMAQNIRKKYYWVNPNIIKGKKQVFQVARGTDSKERFIQALKCLLYSNKLINIETIAQMTSLHKETLKPLYAKNKLMISCHNDTINKNIIHEYCTNAIANGHKKPDVLTISQQLNISYAKVLRLSKTLKSTKTLYSL